MSALSNYLENALANHVLRGIALPSPPTVYLALFTSDPTDANTGVEVSGGSYARQDTAFAVPSNGATSNTTDVVFPIASAGWGTITHFGVYDAATAGNLLIHGTFQTAKTIFSGDQYLVRAGDLDVTFS